MWVWRDDTALARRGTAPEGGSPGWRLDAAGTWAWDEPSLLERAGVGVGALRSGFSAEAAIARAVSVVPAARTAEPGMAGTPIFHALSEDRSRRSVLRAVPDADRAAPSVPEPHPGSGPLPIQDPSATGGRARRGLAEVPTVPPPPAGGASDEQAAESPEDELRRRAERRRRPRTEPEAAPVGGGRHAMRDAQVTGGRHAMR